MTEPGSLYYFYHDPLAWRARTDHLSAIARAAFRDLRDSAWMAEAHRGAPPCSLPDDDAQLARFARLEFKEWKKVAASVRALFGIAADVTTKEALLIDQELVSTWRDAHEAYAARASAGSKGGRAKAEKLRLLREAEASSNASSGASSNASSGDASKAVANGQHLKSNGVVPPATSVAGVVPSPRAHAAPSPVGAAPRGSGVRVPHQTGSEPDDDPLQSDRAKRYRRVLQQSVDQWLFMNPPKADELEASVRQRMGLPGTGLLSPAKSRVVQEAMLEEVRALNKWPRIDQWNEKHPDMTPAKGAPSSSNAIAMLAAGGTP